MKANELMIGDWVMFPYGIDKIVDLPYIEGKGLCASFAASATLFPVPVERLKPIPLTPEILEKNGFDLEGDGASFPCYEDTHLAYMIEWGYHDGTPILHIASYHPNAKNYGTFLKHGANNVHELQHALRLCGIEKEVVL